MAMPSIVVQSNPPERRHRAWPALLRCLRAFGLAALCVGSVAVHAQGYPNRPVKLIDPYAPGGSTTVVSQILSQRFEALTGQPLVVEYKPGAGSNIGSHQVARAPADGYTLLMGTSSLAINPSVYKDMLFDPVEDLAPIVLLTRAPNVLAVNPALGVDSVQALIEHARAHPGKLNYGSSGVGATNHMGMELFKRLAGVDLVHVPFKGGSEAMSALVGGQTQVMLNPASTLMPQARAGKIHALAVGSTEPVPGLDLPTVASAGVAGFESVVWFGLFAPAGTPQAVIDRLNADMNRILQDEQVRTVLHDAGLATVGGTPQELEQLLAHDTRQWAEVAKASGQKPQ